MPNSTGALFSGTSRRDGSNADIFCTANLSFWCGGLENCSRVGDIFHHLRYMSLSRAPRTLAPPHMYILMFSVAPRRHHNGHVHVTYLELVQRDPRSHVPDKHLPGARTAREHLDHVVSSGEGRDGDREDTQLHT